MKLQTKIIFIVIIISFTINMLFRFNSIRIQKIDSENILNSKIKLTSELLTRVNSGPLFYYDTQLIETNISSFLEDPEIKSIHIQESSGEIDLYYENSTNDKDLITVDTDIFFEEEKIGRITVVYTKEIINNYIYKTQQTALLSLILSSIIIAVTLLLRMKPIIKPITELTEQSREISNGNLDKEIKIYNSDEIGQLTISFMKMRDSIKEKISSLKFENEERKKVEIALRVRTTELASANEELTTHRVHLQELVSQKTSELQDSINNLEQAKDQLVESEKMASLGDLVAGIAHEINTPVGIGVTAASHLESEISALNECYKNEALSKSKLENFIELSTESSKIILSNMLRAASLIQSFKKVAVDQSSEEKRRFYITEYINEVLISIQSKFKKTKHLINVICNEDFRLNSYPGAISQIITNLCINTLQHGFEGIESGIITIEVKEINKKAVIIYKDNGIGIPQDILKRIFDPFFTTKRGQGGSGLGMNIVYNLVTQTLNGTIVCDSSHGDGTVFKITLPIEV